MKKYIYFLTFVLFAGFLFGCTEGAVKFGIDRIRIYNANTGVELSATQNLDLGVTIPLKAVLKNAKNEIKQIDKPEEKIFWTSDDMSRISPTNKGHDILFKSSGNDSAGSTGWVQVEFNKVSYRVTFNFEAP